MPAAIGEGIRYGCSEKLLEPQAGKAGKPVGYQSEEIEPRPKGMPLMPNHCLIPESCIKSSQFVSEFLRSF